MYAIRKDVTIEPDAIGCELYLLKNSFGNVVDNCYAKNKEQAKKYFLENNPTLDEMDIDD